MGINISKNHWVKLVYETEKGLLFVFAKKYQAWFPRSFLVSDRLFADCNERFSRISAVPRVSPREGAFIHRRCAYVVGVRRRNC